MKTVVILCGIINAAVLLLALLGTESISKKHADIISDVAVCVCFISTLIMLVFTNILTIEN